MIPSTDIGSDTFARFRYQGELTFPFCLHCALGTEIVSVIPEHFEDIAIEYTNRWRFLQIKSRNPERGPWKLSDVTGAGDALPSLNRTHIEIQNLNATLELLLEGATDSKDAIGCLKAGQDHADPDLITKVSKALKLGKDEAKSFLSRIILSTPHAPRPNVKAMNILLIQEQNKVVPHLTVEIIYEEVLKEILRAMAAEPVGPKWPRYVTHPVELIPEAQEKLNSKKLTRSSLQAKVLPLTNPPRSLLRQITASNSRLLSPLEQKLIAGGASSEIIAKARLLRANAQECWITQRSQNLFMSDDLLEDLRQRLETHAISKKALHQRAQYPANAMFDALLTQFSANPKSIDLNNLMHADPMLLLGETCELSELCRTDWGIADA